jgi:YidC/Oxa1 family membrane protein insertase
MFQTYIYQPILSLLLWLNSFTGNLGLSIIALTFVIRGILLPLTLPSIKAAAKMRDLKPELDEIKRKYKNNKTKQQQAQLELFQQHKLNPASGCLPQIAQFVVLIALYRVFIDYLNGDAIQNTAFLWLDLKSPDPTFILPIVTALTQLILSLTILPGSDTSAEKTLAATSSTKTDDQSADDMSQMAATMQQQMVFMMPLMTGFLALRFPSGLALYWVISTVFSLVQQLIISGPGGLTTYLAKVNTFFNRSK